MVSILRKLLISLNFLLKPPVPPVLSSKFEAAVSSTRIISANKTKYQTA